MPSRSPVAPYALRLLDRKFVAEAPNQVWLADITYLHTGEGWLYLAAVLDLATRKAVGWSMREHMRAELTCAALTMAVQRQRPAPGLLHHSDRGGQGGFKWSSQHPEGCCNGQTEAELGSGGTGRALVAGAAGGGAS